ncbi:MAG: GGDEF domain-containing protein [Elusimicrobia bacterium]|nr:GGDEF domain-containing protein [Elusimicrobiota bacterium]
MTLLLHPLVLGAFLISTPGLAFWVSWPRRRWAALELTVCAALVWAAGFALVSTAHGRELWIATGAWTVLGGLYAVYVVSRNAGEYDRLEAAVAERGTRKDALQREVAQAKAKGSKVEAEQREVLALYGLVKGLSEALTWDEIRPKLEAAVLQFVGIEEFGLYVCDLRAQNALHPLVTRRLGTTVGASWETLDRYLKERKVALSAPHVMDKPDRAVIVPIREGQELMGLFFGRVPEGADPQALITRAHGFAEETGFAFRRLKLFQEVERLSQIDGLTGVARRGVLDMRLKDETVRAKTFKTTFCVMLLDIDHFKKLNDTYGHQFGDQVLRRVAEIIKDSVYETDFVARYGGEEFCILAPRADAVGVLRKAEAVRSNVEREVFHLGMQEVRVTVSIGISHFPRDGNTPEEVVHRADDALYHCKETGRNRAIDIATVRR